MGKRDSVYRDPHQHGGFVHLLLSITSQNVANAGSTAPVGPTAADEAVPGWGSVDSLGMEGSNTRGATGWRFA